MATQQGRLLAIFNSRLGLSTALTICLYPFLTAVAWLPFADGARAQTATWIGGTSSDYHTASNWSPAAVPNSTATDLLFGPAALNMTVSALAGSNAAAFIFEAGSPSFVFSIGPTATGFGLHGAGIVNNSGLTQTINLHNAGLIMNNNASMGDNIVLNLTGAGQIDLNDTSSGGLASFNLNGTNGVLINGDNRAVSMGSLSGTGWRVQFSGQNQSLTIGGNNQSTSYSGQLWQASSGVNASLIKIGTGTLTLSGTANYSGGTTIAGGTLSVSSNSHLGAASGALTLNGGRLLVTGNTFTSMTRNITLGLSNGIIHIADPTNVFTLTQNIGGPGSLIKFGAGTMVLAGNNTYAGTTTVDGGTLLVNGSIASSSTFVTNGSTLGGSGTVGNTHILSGGILSAGNSPGTLTVAGNLTLHAGSISVFELNSPGVVGGTGTTGNDLVAVAGNLMLGGTLDARVAAAGYYRLFDYGGTLNGTFSGGTVTGTGGFTPVNPNNPDVQYGIPGQVNLAVLASGQNMQFWDGSDAIGDGVIDGGAGTWSAAGTNWTGKPGQANVNGTFAGSVGVFAGAAGGVVSVAGTQGFDTLQFSTDGYRLEGGALAIGVAGSGSVNVDNSVSTTIATSIGDGAGTALRKTGSGTLVLSGANTYTGGTSLLGGVLSVASDANLGAAGGGLLFDGGLLATTASFDSNRAMTLDAAAAIDVATATTLGLGGAIGGSSGLVKQGDGTLILSGANSYGGGTSVAAGTLIGDTSSIRGDLTNAGAVIFEQAGNAAFAGDVTGHGGTDGTMTKRGAGVLTLTGMSSLDWSIEAGGLVSASDRFGGNAVIDGGASFTIDQATDGIYAGVLSGSGSVFKTGPGALLLSGDSSAFAGTTSVNAGLLSVGDAGAGALGGSLVVNAGGVLAGTGSLGAAGSTVTVAAGGVHTPGNSIGTQFILGDYANHGILRIEASPTAADKLVVAGAVDITGATLELMLAPANAADWNVFNGPYTIIDKQSAGAVTGNFGAAASNLLFLDTLLAYDGGDGNDVTLELVRNGLAFVGVGQTRNQIATGTAVETLGNTNPAWRSIAASTSPDVVRASFDILSGEIHASTKTALIEDSRFLRNTINDRIRAAFDGIGAAAMPVMAYAEGGAQFVPATTDDPALWGQAFGSWGHWNGDGNAAQLDRSIGGFLAGADASAFDSWRFGAVAGYSRTAFNATDRASSGYSDNYHVGVYGGSQWGDAALRTGAAYTLHDISTSRSVVIPGLSDSLTASYNAGTTQVFGELAYGFSAGDVRFEPFANLAYANLHMGGFTEQGGAAALTVASSDIDAIFTTLGLRASATFDLGGATLTAKGMLGWRHAFGDTAPLSDMRFAGGNAFSIAGVPTARDTAVVEAGLDYTITPNATFGLSYGGQFGSGMSDQSVKAGFSLKF